MINLINCKRSIIKIPFETMKMACLALMLISFVSTASIVYRADKPSVTPANLIPLPGFENGLNELPATAPISHASNSIPNAPKRFKRNPAGDFNFKADRVSMLARVLTGISLQNGLMNGSIPGDEVIAELLNIGLVNLTDVETFDKAKVDTFLSNLKETGNMDNDALKFENGISVIQNVEMLWSNVTGLEKLPNSTALDKLDLLKPVNLTVLNGDVDEALKYLKDLLSLPDDTATNSSSQAAATLVFAKSQTTLAPLEGILIAVKSLKTEPIPWEELLTISQNLEVLGPFGEAMETSRNVFLVEILADHVKNAFVKNIGKVEGIIFDSGSEFEVMKFFSTRSAQVKQHSPGFVNGYHDLKYLPADSKNPWLLETLNTGLPIEKGLERLLLFNETAVEVDSNWSNIANRSLQHSVERTIQLQTAAQKFKHVFETVNQTFSSLENCRSLHYSYSGNILKIIAEDSSGLRMALEALNAMFGMLTDEEIATFNNLTKSITVSSVPAENLIEVPRAVTNAKNKKGTIEMLQKLAPFLATIRNSKTFDELMKQITSYKNTIIKFHQDTNFANMMKYFNCFQAMKTNLQTVSDVVNFVNTLRQSTGFDEVIVDVRKVLNAIANSVPVVTTIRSIPDQFKTNHTAEETEMRKLTSLANTTKTFGIAVTGVVAIQRALLKRQSFQGIVNGLQSLNNSIEALTDPTVKANVKAGWGDIDGSKKMIQDLMSELNTKMGEAVRARRATSDLTEFGKFFSSLANMTDVDLDVDRKIDALDALVAADPASQTAVSPVRDSLNEVSNLDLKFSRYSTALTSIPNGLVTIKTLFDSLVPPVVNQNQNPGNNGQNPVVVGAPLDEKTTDASSTVVYTILIVIISFACLVVLVYFLIAFWNWIKNGYFSWPLFGSREIEEEKAKLNEERAKLLHDGEKLKADIGEKEKLLVDRRIQDELEMERHRKEDAEEVERLRLEALQDAEKMKKETAEDAERKKKEIAEDAERKKKEIAEDAERKKKETAEEAEKVHKKAAEDAEKIKKDAAEEAERENIVAVAKMDIELQKKTKEQEKKLKKKKRSIDKAASKERNKLATDAHNMEMEKKKLADEKMKLAEEKKKVKKAIDDVDQQAINMAERRRDEKNVGEAVPVADQALIHSRDGGVEIDPVELNALIAFFESSAFDPDKVDKFPEGKQQILTYHYNKAIPPIQKTKQEMNAKEEHVERRRFVWPLATLTHPTCFEANAVKLANEEDSFINANNIRFPLIGRAIATQIPLAPRDDHPGTIEDFLKMICQEDVETIVLITSSIELERKDFGKYYGETEGAEVKAGRFTVTTTAVVESSDGILIERDLLLTDSAEPDPAKKTRKLKQHHITKWYQGHGPRGEQALAVVKKVHLATRRKNKPLVVQCLDGAQRTGTFLGIEYLHQMVRQLGGLAKLEHFVSLIRGQRDGAIVTAEALYYVVCQTLQLMIEEADAAELNVRMRTQWDNYNKFNDAKHDMQLKMERQQKIFERRPKAY